MYEEQDKIEAALEIAYRHAHVEGAHHKAWVIDQMVGALLGDDYEEWVQEYNEQNSSKWDVGVTP